MLTQAFGATASRAACKNPAARETMDTVKTVVEHLNKSNLMKVRDVDDGTKGFENMVLDWFHDVSRKNRSSVRDNTHRLSI